MIRDFLFRRLLLIYQMPKTASQTVEATLRQLPLSRPIVRFHSLSPKVARKLRDAVDSTGPSEAWKQKAREQLAFMARASRLLRWRRVLHGWEIGIPRLEIITAVREPIGLTLSSVFENHAYYAQNLESLTLETCREAVLRPRMFNSIDDWFETELQVRTGLDVFAEPFQPDKGYQIYENSFARALLYRFDALPALPAMLREFLGVEVPAVSNRNLGSAKEYAEAYRYVKDHLRLPADFVAARSNIRLTRHFYSEEERRALRERWAAPPGEAEDSPARAALAE